MPRDEELFPACSLPATLTPTPEGLWDLAGQRLFREAYPMLEKLGSI